MQITHHFTDDEFWARIAGSDEELRASFDRAGAFEIAGWQGPVSIGEWGFTGGLRSLTFGVVPLASGSSTDSGEPVASTHPVTAVTVLVEDGTSPRDFVAQRRQVLAVMDDPEYRPPAVDVPALPDDVRVIMVDDVPVAFEIWAQPGRWCAAGQIRELTVAIEADSELADDASLRLVTNIEPYIDGRNALIRGMRGGI
ncbi:hypothetical protein [Leifsonia sp. A12D58]|uniref:hypothetical protein n=1 Tax=Leifsonia sp. A12D58 TaxID=3397674 RepID=UPI0039E04B30